MAPTQSKPATRLEREASLKQPSKQHLVLDDNQALVRKLIGALKNIVKRPIVHTGNGLCSCCETVFMSIYNIYLAEVKFEEDDLRTISHLVVKLFPYLVEGVGNLRSISLNFGGYVVQLRSGVQFFMDKILKFRSPTGCTLEETVDQIQVEILKNLLEHWDDVLRTWKTFDYMPPDTFGDPDEFNPPPGMPESHFWWLFELM